jgi:hypothetical protein
VKELGCIQFSASAWALEERDKWIGWNIEDRKERLHLIVNNSRYLIFPWVKVKNLASKSLSLSATYTLYRRTSEHASEARNHTRW